MILYRQLLKMQKQTEELSKRLSGDQMLFNMTFKCVWAGDIKDILEVEIKSSKEENGWLYSDAYLVLFRRHGELFEILLSELRAIVEEKLKDKKFSNHPEDCCLVKKGNGKIHGYISVKHLNLSDKEIKYEGDRVH